MLDKKNKKYLPGADPGFQVRGAHLNKCWGISCEKSRLYAKKSSFFPILGGGGGVDNFSFVHPCWSGVYFSKPVTCKSQKY